MTLLYKDHKVYEGDAYTELGELIENLRDLGIFQMKTRDEAIDAIRHTTFLESYYASELDNTCLNVEYKHIETDIYFNNGKVYMADFVDFYNKEEDEEYTYYENWYPEQKEN